MQRRALARRPAGARRGTDLTALAGILELLNGNDPLGPCRQRSPFNAKGQREKGMTWLIVFLPLSLLNALAASVALVMVPVLLVLDWANPSAPTFVLRV